MDRATWTGLSDEQLLDQCKVDTYRASGPGGQKRNKTSSAVRIRHLPTGLLVIAEESRSQHENKSRALRRLRQALYLKIRNSGAVEPLAQHEVMRGTLDADGRLRLNHKDGRFWPAVGLLLDALAGAEGRVSDAARMLGISTGNLISFLSSEPKVWAQVNTLRTRFGAKPLHS